MPWFIKSRWLSIEPEYDPFKYNSFTKNAGAQMWSLTQVVQSRLARARTEERMDELPPMLTFQSVVDATIVGRDVVTHLYERLDANGSELVAFDVNDLVYLSSFYIQDRRSALQAFEENVELPFRFTVVTNRGDTSREVVARSKPPFSQVVSILPLGLSWPDQVYSLSHVALPFAPDDPLYGYRSAEGGDDRLRLGQLALRGEMQVLSISAAQILRLRSNPFHAYIRARIEETLGEN
jgi:hypothetical protein